MANTKADIISIRLKVQRGIGNDARRAELIAEIETLERDLTLDPTLDISDPISEIAQELEDTSRVVPLAAVLGVLIVVPSILWAWGPTITQDSDFLGFDAVFIITAFGAGFLGTFVRVLNKIVNYEYSSMTRTSAALVMILRPVAGAILGLFVASLFAAGGIGTPINGIDDDPIFNGISKGYAFIFGVAFVAGLVDDFAFNLANRLAAAVQGNEKTDE